MGAVFLASATVLVRSDVALARRGDDLAERTGWGRLFGGMRLVALATSLLGLVAARAAVRIGAGDLAVGNLFGSNAVNMALLVAIDLAYTGGPVLPAGNRPELVAAIGAIVLMAVALAAIVHGGETRIMRLEQDAVLLLAAYGGRPYAVWAAHA